MRLGCSRSWARLDGLSSYVSTFENVLIFAIMTKCYKRNQFRCSLHAMLEWSRDLIQGKSFPANLLPSINDPLENFLPLEILLVCEELSLIEDPPHGNGAKSHVGQDIPLVVALLHFLALPPCQAKFRLRYTTLPRVPGRRCPLRPLTDSIAALR